MNHHPIEGANLTLAKDQAEYATIAGYANAHTRSLNAATGEEYDSGPSITVAFKPTMEEIMCMLNGGTVYLRVHGTRFPPVSLWAE